MHRFCMSPPLSLHPQSQQASTQHFPPHIPKPIFPLSAIPASPSFVLPTKQLPPSSIPQPETPKLIFDGWGGQESNIILAQTHEYRLPPPPKSTSSTQPKPIVQDLTSRYLGLVVVPGEYIIKIEVEEFASQIKNGSQYAQPVGKGKEGEGFL